MSRGLSAPPVKLHRPRAFAFWGVWRAQHSTPVPGHLACRGDVPIISPPLGDPASRISSHSQRRSPPLEIKPAGAKPTVQRLVTARRVPTGRNLGTDLGVRMGMSKTGLFAGAGLTLGWEISLLRASSKPRRAGPRPLATECEVSIPLRAGLAIQEKNRFSLFWFPPSKQSAEVRDLSRRCVCYHGCQARRLPSAAPVPDGCS